MGAEKSKTPAVRDGVTMPVIRWYERRLLGHVIDLEEKERSNRDHHCNGEGDDEHGHEARPGHFQKGVECHEDDIDTADSLENAPQPLIKGLLLKKEEEVEAMTDAIEIGCDCPTNKENKRPEVSLPDAAG